MPEIIKIEFDAIPNRKQSSTPFFTHCRRLIKQGVDPESKLEIWDKGTLRMYTPINIGFSAKWTVQEEPNIRLVKYVPPSINNIAVQPTTPTPVDSLK